MLHQSRQRPATVLIVDDEPIQLRAIVTELNALGFETLIAREGADGLAKAQRGNPDLIPLDILMPGWDGYETCHRLKADPATRPIPVIVEMPKGAVVDRSFLRIKCVMTSPVSTMMRDCKSCPDFLSGAG